MNEQKMQGLMGLTVRARQAVFGEDGCLKTIRGGECALLLLEETASNATQDKYRGACHAAGVPLMTVPQGLLHMATGRPGVAMAVRSGGLAEQMLKLCDQAKEEQQQATNQCGGASV